MNKKIYSTSSYEAPSVEFITVNVEQGFATTGGDAWSPDPTIPDNPSIIDPYGAGYASEY